MCRVKSGINIKNKNDLQNMVIGIILRQKDKYLEQDIINAVTYFSSNSTMEIDSFLIKNIVKDNLDFLLRTKRLFCMDGVYTPLRIEQFQKNAFAVSCHKKQL